MFSLFTIYVYFLWHMFLFTFFVFVFFCVVINFITVVRLHFQAKIFILKPKNFTIINHRNFTRAVFVGNICWHIQMSTHNNIFIRFQTLTSYFVRCLFKKLSVKYILHMCNDYSGIKMKIIKVKKAASYYFCG